MKNDKIQHLFFKIDKVAGSDAAREQSNIQIPFPKNADVRGKMVNADPLGCQLYRFIFHKYQLPTPTDPLNHG